MQNHDLPLLLWGRTQDEILLGEDKSAVTNMVNILSNYPTHPDFNKWFAITKDKVTLLKKMAGTPAITQAEKPSEVKTSTEATKTQSP